MVLAALVVIYLLVGYFAIPVLAKDQITKLVTDQTGVAPTLQNVRFDPWQIRLFVEGFELREDPATPPALQFEALIVDLHPLGFLTSDVALDELRLVRPRLSAVFDEQAELNLVRLFSGKRDSGSGDANEDAASNASKEDESEALVVDIGRVEIEGGLVEFRDLSIEEPFELTLTPIDLEMLAFTTRLGGTSSYELNLSMGPSSTLRWAGNGQLSPFSLEGLIDLDDFDLMWPSDYLARQLRFEVVDGSLSVSTRYVASFEEGFDLALSDARLDLSDLSIVEADRVEGQDPGEVLALPSLSARGIEASIQDSNFDSLLLNEVSVDGGRVLARLAEEGGLDLIETFTPVELEGDAETDIGSEPSSETSPSEVETTAPPRIRVGEVAIRDFTVDFEDRSQASPVAIRLKPMSLTARGYDSAPGSSLDFELAAATEEGGSLTLAGPVALDPLDVRLDLAVSEWPLSVLAPYARSAARLDVPKGSLSSKLDVRVAAADPKTDDAPGWSAKGALRIDGFLATDAKDDSDLVEWKTLSLDGLDLAADKIEADEIGLVGFATRFEISKGGTNNFEAILEEAEPDVSGRSEGKSRAGKKDDEQSAAGSSFRIDRFQLDDARVAFVDKSISPTFATNLSSLGGTVEGLSSTQKGRAKLSFKGLVDETAPLQLNGRVNPFRTDSSNQIEMTLTDLSMPIFAAYSGRYVGHGIDGGKLEMTLDYQWVARSLEASNHFKLERFAFGERTGSASATSLPVPLALGLMRGPGGVIEIDLPITGNLDDPSFNLLGLLGKAFTQLITKVATAPFSVIGGIVGFSAEELSQVIFDAGSDRLSEAERREIDRLAEALAERSELSVEIRGRADPNLDGFQMGTDGGADAGRDLARARAASIRSALLENSAIASERVFLVEVEIGAFGSETGVASQLSLIGG